MGLPHTWVLLKAQWSVPTAVRMPPATAALMAARCSAVRMGGDMTKVAARSKSGSSEKEGGRSSRWAGASLAATLGGQPLERGRPAAGLSCSGAGGQSSSRTGAQKVTVGTE